MEARSSNSMGRWVHYGGDLAYGVNDGIGGIMRSASTGSTTIFEPLSDSDTAGLKIRAKGAATLTLGNSSNAVVVKGSALTLNSGLGIKGVYSTTFGYDLSSGVVAGAQFSIFIASTSADVMPGDLFAVQLQDTTATIAIQNIRVSTANTSRVSIGMVNYSATTLTTLAGLTGRITWLDLT